MSSIKKDDKVKVLSGKNKGKEGKVLKVNREKDTALVERVNIVKRHTKPNPNAGQAGGIIEKEAAISVSNIAIFNPESSKADRVGFRIEEDGKKSRIFKSTNKAID
jgi:large subunit ribosomal protein L24